MIEISPPPFLPRSALACWWSIAHLIRVASPCYLWTFTSPYAMPLWWFGLRHGKLVRFVSDWAQLQKQSSHGGTIPRNWGGVRVFETNPKGTGFHAHWVMRGRMDWHLMQAAALKAGLGKIVHVHTRPVGLKTAHYLATYLSKEDAMPGARRWANLGTYDGIGKRDIIQDSQRIRDIKAWHLYYMGLGQHRFMAYKRAVLAVDSGMSLPNAVPF